MTTDQNWKTLTVAENEAMAELLQQELDKAGVPCVVESTGASAFQGAAASYEVRVPADKLERARKFLKD